MNSGINGVTQVCGLLGNNMSEKIYDKMPFGTVVLSEEDTWRLKALAKTVRGSATNCLDAEDWCLFADISTQVNKEIVSILEKYT